jgi:3-oxoacyl-[acyl-carrier protein] reductase
VDLGLRGKVAIVGGSSQGIGFAIARQLAAEGAGVTLTARREADLAAAAAAIREETGTVVATLPGDVRKADDNARVIAETVRTFGRLDILVNNDGAPPVGAVAEFDDAKWERAIQQNFMSVVRMVRGAVPHMTAAGGGRIVNITSTSVKQPLPSLGLSVATWAGVHALAKTLSLELGPAGITVNTVCPGRIATPRLQQVMGKRAEIEGRDPSRVMREGLADIPLGRYGTPDDIAGLVAFLASARGGFITGVTIQVDGGLVRSLL